MSKADSVLSERLKKLENDINMMVMMQRTERTAEGRERITLGGATITNEGVKSLQISKSRNVTPKGKCRSSTKTVQNQQNDSGQATSRSRSSSSSPDARKYDSKNVKRRKGGYSKPPVTTTIYSSVPPICEANKSPIKCECIHKSNLEQIKQKKTDDACNPCSYQDKYWVALKNWETEKDKRLKLESTVESMTFEIEKCKQNIDELTRDKRVAQDMGDELRQKYEEIARGRKQVLDQLESLHSENCELQNKLKEEINSRQDLIKKAVEKATVPTKKQDESCKKLQLVNVKLNKSLKEKEDELKKAMEEIFKLTEMLNEYKEDINSVKKEVQTLQQKTEQYRNKDKRDLEEMEVSLKESVENEKRTRERIEYMTTRLKATLDRENKILKDLVEMEERLAECQTNEREACERMEELEIRCEEYATTEKHLHDELDKLKVKLRESIESEIRAREEIQLLEKEISDLKKPPPLQPVIVKLNKAFQISSEKADKMCETTETKNSEVVECELNSLLTIMKQKELQLLKEKEDFQQVVQELSEIVAKQKSRIGEVMNLNKQQEILLQSQSAAMASKDEQLRLGEAEVEALRTKTRQLERQLCLLRKSMGTFQKLHEALSIQNNAENNSEKVKSLEGEIQNLKQQTEQAKAALLEEKDKILIKEKIIEDQLNTINSLKATANKRHDEVIQTKSQLIEIEKEIAKQQDEKLKIMNDFEVTVRSRNQLKEQVVQLQYKLQKFPKVHFDFEKQQKMLTELELQVLHKHRQWETSKAMLLKEKNQAVIAARFATQKLVDTIKDFQEEVESHKRIQRLMAGVIHDKDAQIKNVNRKVELLTQNAKYCLMNTKNSFEHPPMTNTKSSIEHPPMMNTKNSFEHPPMMNTKNSFEHPPMMNTKNSFEHPPMMMVMPHMVWDANKLRYQLIHKSGSCSKPSFPNKSYSEAESSGST